jgi:prolipoprotein diacylglyceryltransferase
MVPYLDIGTLRIGTHDLFTTIALLVGFVIYYRDLRARGLLESRIFFISLGALVGGAIGARTVLAWEHLDWYGPALANHSLTWVIENSGKSIIGAIVGAWVAMAMAKRALGYRRSTGDAYAFALPVGMVIGRVGCFLSELPLGKPTDLPWGVSVDPAAASAFAYCPGCELPMHPTMLYEIAFYLVAIGILFGLRRRIVVRGDLVRVFLLAAGLFRFLVEFIRTSPPQAFGLTAPQLVLIPLLALLVAHFVRQVRRGAYSMPAAPLALTTGSVLAGSAAPARRR